MGTALTHKKTPLISAYYYASNISHDAPRLSIPLELLTKKRRRSFWDRTAETYSLSFCKIVVSTDTAVQIFVTPRCWTCVACPSIYLLLPADDIRAFRRLALWATYGEPGFSSLRPGESPRTRGRKCPGVKPGSICAPPRVSWDVLLNWARWSQVEFVSVDSYARELLVTP